jgi:hypothetical protein
MAVRLLVVVVRSVGVAAVVVEVGAGSTAQSTGLVIAFGVECDGRVAGQRPVADRHTGRHGDRGQGEDASRW